MLWIKYFSSQVESSNKGGNKIAFDDTKYIWVLFSLSLTPIQSGIHFGYGWIFVILTVDVASHIHHPIMSSSHVFTNSETTKLQIFFTNFSLFCYKVEVFIKKV